MSDGFLPFIGLMAVCLVIEFAAERIIEAIKETKQEKPTEEGPRA